MAGKVKYTGVGEKTLADELMRLDLRARITGCAVDYSSGRNRLRGVTTQVTMNVIGEHVEGTLTLEITEATSLPSLSREELYQPIFVEFVASERSAPAPVFESAYPFEVTG